MERKPYFVILPFKGIDDEPWTVVGSVDGLVKLVKKWAESNTLQLHDELKIRIAEYDPSEIEQLDRIDVPDNPQTEATNEVPKKTDSSPRDTDNENNEG